MTLTLYWSVVADTSHLVMLQTMPHHDMGSCSGSRPVVGVQGSVGEDATTKPDQLLLQLGVRHPPLRQHLREEVVDAQQSL